MKSIANDSKFKYFLSMKQLSPESLKSYTRELSIYSQVAGLSPSELIDEARQEEQKIPYMEDRKLPFHFQDFISFMEHKDYAPYRIKNAITIIRMF
jgi:hypothetical protein